MAKRAEPDDLDALLARANAGKAKAQDALRDALATRPDGERVREQFGNLAFQAEAALVRAAGGENAVVREAVWKKLAALVREVAGPAPTPLERLLAQRVALCWLALHYYETIYTQRMPDLSLAQSEFHQRRLTHAHKRYLAAIKALAQVRRLQLPAVQVNIGERQVNVAAGGPAAKAQPPAGTAAPSSSAFAVPTTCAGMCRNRTSFPLVRVPERRATWSAMVRYGPLRR